MESKTQQAIVINSFAKGYEYTDSYPIKSLAKGYVLIKVAYGLVIPADLFNQSGLYGRKQPSLPCVGGFEGSGYVIEVGEGVSSDLVGKLVGFWSSSESDDFHGSWAEFTVLRKENLFVFNDKVDAQQAAMSHINPISTLGMLHSVLEKKAKTVVVDSALSSLNRMFIRVLAANGIKTIALVRNPNQIEKLKELGNELNLNTTDADFKAQLKELAYANNATVAFSSVAGELTGILARSLPDGSTVYVLGNLAGKATTEIGVTDLIFRNIKLQGWWLATFISEHFSDFLKASKEIEDTYNSGSDLFFSEVAQVVPLREMKTGLELYLKDMSKGRLLLTPDN